MVKNKSRKGDVSTSTFSNLAKILVIVGLIGILGFFIVFGRGEQHRAYSELEAEKLWSRMKYPPMLLKHDHRGYPEPVIDRAKVDAYDAIDCGAYNIEGCVNTKPHDYCWSVECPSSGYHKELGNTTLCTVASSGTLPSQSPYNVYDDTVPLYDPSTGKTYACIVRVVLNMRA